MTDNPISSVDEIERILSVMHDLKMCTGFLLDCEAKNIQTTFCCEDEGKLRHVNCCFYLPENSLKKQCSYCTRAKYTLNQKIIRLKRNDSIIQSFKLNSHLKDKKTVEIMKQKLKIARSSKKRAIDKVNLLQNSLNDCREKIVALSTDSLSEELNSHGLSNNEKLAIKEILSAAKKKNTKNRKYSEDWILLCMLLHMRSPASYNFLRDNEVLPLPSIRTIRR